MFRTKTCGQLSFKKSLFARNCSVAVGETTKDNDREFFLHYPMPRQVYIARIYCHTIQMTLRFIAITSEAHRKRVKAFWNLFPLAPSVQLFWFSKVIPHQNPVTNDMLRFKKHICFTSNAFSSCQVIEFTTYRRPPCTNFGSEVTLRAGRRSVTSTMFLHLRYYLRQVYVLHV